MTCWLRPTCPIDWKVILLPKFSAHVVMMGPDYRPVSFAPGDEVPEWATVGEHVIAADEPDSEPAEVDSDVDDDPDLNPEAVPDDAPDFTAPAPRRSRSRK